MAWWEELTSEEQARMPDDWVPGEMPLSGTPPDILAKYDPAVAATQERAASSEFEQFAAQYEGQLTDGKIHGFTPWELFHMDRGPGGSLFVDPSGADGGDDGGDGGESGDYTTTTEFRTLKQGFLSELLLIGLDADTINDLWDWVEERFVADESFTSAQAMVEIYDQKAFKDRFPGITEMRKDTGRRDIPTPGDYLARERWLGQKFEQYGLTALGANLDNLIAESYINTIGTAELEERLLGASAMIFEAPEEVKSTFGRWYGPLGDAALMAAFLDPDDTIFGGEWKNWSALKGNVAAAEVGGWSKMLLDLEAPVTQDRAERISKLGFSEREIWSRFSTLKEQEDLFSERITETVDLDLVTTGVESAFNLSQDATDLLRRRQETRAAEFQGAGGALLSGTTTGFGAANA